MKEWSECKTQHIWSKFNFYLPAAAVSTGSGLFRLWSHIQNRMILYATYDMQHEICKSSHKMKFNLCWGFALNWNCFLGLDLFGITSTSAFIIIWRLGISIIKAQFIRLSLRCKEFTATLTLEFLWFITSEHIQAMRLWKLVIMNQRI